MRPVIDGGLGFCNAARRRPPRTSGKSHQRDHVNPAPPPAASTPVRLMRAIDAPHAAPTECARARAELLDINARIALRGEPRQLRASGQFLGGHAGGGETTPTVVWAANLAITNAFSLLQLRHRGVNSSTAELINREASARFPVQFITVAANRE